MKIHRNIKKGFSFTEYFKENNNFLWSGDTSKMLEKAKKEKFVDLLVTSPPYNIGKSYENDKHLDDYRKEHKDFLAIVTEYLKPSGSICYQLGNYIKKDGSIYPLDYIFHEIFEELGYKLKNRIIWSFGHGLHAQNRFSGRYEIINWYVKNNDYTFNLDDIRVKQKYPGKRFYKGPNKGKISSNKKGKNPSDFWNDIPRDVDVWIDIPNVRGNHIEKTDHPCQFPIALVERLVKALTNKNEIVFDPYMGVGSAGAAANINDRKFLGSDLDNNFVITAKKRISEAINGNLRYREDKPIFNHEDSPLSKLPKE